jgi:hypothetical protein
MPDQPEAREGKTGLHGMAERPVLPRKPGNSGGGKGPWFKGDAGSSEGEEIGVSLRTPERVWKLQGAEWVATTQAAQWQRMNRLTISSVSETGWDVEIQVDTPLQTIDGFGACFNELGWTSLSALNDDDKEAIFR